MTYDQQTLARLLRLLPPAPAGAVAAAQALPLVRGRLDEIVGRAEADARFRAELIANLEAALAAAGYEPHTALVEALRTRLGTD